MGNGSSWWTPVYEGLFEGKHYQAMGPAIWLYGWILMRAHAAQRGGLVVYTHEDAAASLHVSRTTVRNWFRTLQENGYVATRARYPRSLEVEVSKWRPIEEWRNSRQLGTGPVFQGGDVEKPDALARGRREDGCQNTDSQASECQSECHCECQDTDTLSIYNRLESYLYPSGRQGAGPPTLGELFRELWEHLRQSKNYPGELRLLYGLIFGEHEDTPPYGRFGLLAKQIGGAGRLLEIMWQLAPKPPTGDVLGYILKAYGPNRRGRRTVEERHQRTRAAVAEFLSEGVADGQQKNDR